MQVGLDERVGFEDRLVNAVFVGSSQDPEQFTGSQRLGGGTCSPDLRQQRESVHDKQCVTLAVGLWMGGESASLPRRRIGEWATV